MSILTLLRRALLSVICALTALHAGHALAATVTYDENLWNPSWGTTANLYSSVGAVDHRRGTIDDPGGNIEIDELSQDSTILRASTAQVSAWATSPGTIVPPGGDPYSARARTDFGENHGAVRSERHYDFDSQSGEFDLTHQNRAEVVSRWLDEWTFSSFGSVTLDLHWDATFEIEPLCLTGPCIVDNPPGTDISTLQRWSSFYRASLGVYDLDDLVPFYDEDSDIEYLYPALITSILIEQIGDDPDAAALAPIDRSESITFLPVEGHRYAVMSELRVSAARGARIDALNTVFLERIVLTPGQTLSSEAVANLGAAYNIETGVPEPSAAWLTALAALLFGAKRRLFAN